MYKLEVLQLWYVFKRARGGAVGWGTALQTGRWRVRFPMVSLSLTETSTRNISWGVKQSVRRADNLSTFMCWLSGNLGILWACKRPLGGLLATLLSVGVGHIFNTSVYQYLWPVLIRNFAGSGRMVYKLKRRSAHLHAGALAVLWFRKFTILLLLKEYRLKKGENIKR